MRRQRQEKRKFRENSCSEDPVYRAAAAAHLGGGAALLDVQAAGLEEAGGGDLVEPRDGAGVQVLPQLAAAGQLLRRRGTRRGHVVRRRAVPSREQGLVVGQPEATRLIAMQ